MLLFLPALMARPLTGDEGHEWVGVCAAVLFVLHNALNFQWYKNLPRGKYTARRALQTAINFLVIVSVAGIVASGAMMSRHAFGFLRIEGGMSFARQLHMVSAYWGFIFMSLHLGLHLERIPGMAKKAAGVSPRLPVPAKASLRGLAVVVAAYGAYAFARHDIASYLLLRNQFAYFDYERAAMLIYADYAAIMFLFAFTAHYAMKLFSIRASKPYKTT